MPSGWYNKGLYELAKGNFDLSNGTYKALLLNTSAAFDRDHNYVTDITANEITAVGYARQTLASKTLTENDTNDAAYWDAADPVFGPMAVGQTVRFMVVYKEVGADATSPLIACWQVVDFATDGGTFQFQVATAGLTKIWSLT